jgi:hypothetical protein
MLLSNLNSKLATPSALRIANDINTLELIRMSVAEEETRNSAFSSVGC